MSTLVTGDAVVLELPPAGLATRLVAFVIDVVVYWAGLLLTIWVMAALLFSLDSAAVAALSLTLAVVVLIIVPTTIETLSRGRSLGKLILGLRVVRDDGGPIRTRHALARQLVGFAEFYILYGVVTIFVVLANSRTKRLGDMLAGTYVINERTPLLGSPMAQMPPELATWAAAADVGQVPGPLALAGRNYLARLATMTPQAARVLGTELADDLARRVAPPPPPGTPADRFIAAVLAERRRRDLIRLAAERAQLARLSAMTAQRRERV